jgi:hypothetical protein
MRALVVGVMLAGAVSLAQAGVQLGKHTRTEPPQTPRPPTCWSTCNGRYYWPSGGPQGLRPSQLPHETLVVSDLRDARK